MSTDTFAKRRNFGGMRTFDSIITAMPVSLDPGGNIDERAVVEIASSLIEGGADGPAFIAMTQPVFTTADEHEVAESSDTVPPSEQGADLLGGCEPEQSCVLTKERGRNTCRTTGEGKFPPFGFRGGGFWALRPRRG